MGALAGRAPAPNEPLMDAGLDSLTSVDARADVSERFGVRLPATALFDYPTAATLARHVASILAPEASVHQSRRASIRATFRIASRSSRTPSAASGANVISPPANARARARARWDVETARVREPRNVPAAFAAFVDAPDVFDGELFGVSPAEAAACDPQQRLLLDAVVALAFASRGVARTFTGSRRGVYAGIASRDYDLVRAVGASGGVASSSLSATASFASVAPGRASFLFDLRGPSVAFDTACSSSLVAAKVAWQDTGRAGSNPAADGAAVVGVNVLLAPDVSEIFRAAGMLSPSGRCKTLDADADGYVRAEACRSVSFVPLRARDDATGRSLEVEPATIVAGAAVNQDGRSSSLTAPNGPSQTAAIRAAMGDARSMAGARRTILQTHGTGTPLGDPIEIGAVRAAFFFDEDDEEEHTKSTSCSVVVLEAAKSWCGHAEPAAGALGLATLCAAAASNSVFGLGGVLRSTNPHAAAAASGASLLAPRQTLPFASNVGGVSAFAFQGTNAHVRVVPHGSGGFDGTLRGDRGSILACRTSAWAAPPATPTLAREREPRDGVFRSFRRDDARRCGVRVHGPPRRRARHLSRRRDASRRARRDARGDATSERRRREDGVDERVRPAPLLSPARSRVIVRVGGFHVGHERVALVSASHVDGSVDAAHLDARPRVVAASRRRGGEARSFGEPGAEFGASSERFRARARVPIDPDAAYRAFGEYGLQYGAGFRPIGALRTSSDGRFVAARLEPPAAAGEDRGVVESPGRRRANRRADQNRRRDASRSRGDRNLHGERRRFGVSESRRGRRRQGVDSRRGRVRPRVRRGFGCRRRAIDRSDRATDTNRRDTRERHHLHQRASPRSNAVRPRTPRSNRATRRWRRSIVAATEWSMPFANRRGRNRRRANRRGNYRVRRERRRTRLGAALSLVVLDGCRRRVRRRRRAIRRARTRRRGRRERFRERVSWTPRRCARTHTLPRGGCSRGFDSGLERRRRFFRRARLSSTRVRVRFIATRRGTVRRFGDEFGDEFGDGSSCVFVLSPSSFPPVAMIVGGCGAVGGAAAAWLAAANAREIILAGRVGRRSKPPFPALENASSTTTRLVSSDCSSSDATFHLRRPVPNGVALRAGGALRDAIISNQTAGGVRAVFSSKRANRTSEDVDAPATDVAFSSVASLLGAAGQANYAAVNAALEAFAASSRRRGRDAIAAQWGAWAGAGMAAADPERARAARLGVGELEPEDGLRALAAMAYASPTTTSVARFAPHAFAVAPFDWRVAARRLPDSVDAARGVLSETIRETIDWRVAARRPEIRDDSRRHCFGRSRFRNLRHRRSRRR